MKRFFIVLTVLVFAASLTAQVRTGNIYGKITDEEGNALPGVSVVLTGPQMAALSTVTTAAGIYRFPSVPPGNQYEIAAELTGFKKATRTNIIVAIGGNAQINLTLEVGTLEEQITVVAQTPIVDTKKTVVGQNIDKEAMQSLPTARDPWVVLQLAPAVMVDRENVGGNESGQQSGFIARGDTSASRYSGNQGANNIWSVDGIDITDPAAMGGSALYYDFDMFEELQITTGGAADVSVQSGGIALNMVTRRGGNRMSLAGRFYLTDGFFQSTNMTDELRAQGILDTNKIQNIKDFGFNAGGPIIKDKLWWWGAYGVQDIFVWTLPSRTGLGTYTPAAQDKSLLNNYNFKLNAQLLANNRFEALITSGAKEKFGRNAGPSKPEGDHQTGKYYWGSPIIKLQDEHVFGNNFYVSLKYSFNDAGFGWRPIVDEAVEFPIVYDDTQDKYVPYTSGMNASWGSYGVSRPRSNYQLQGTYFNDTFLGLSHEIKFGTEYSHKVQQVKAGGSGNIQGFDITRNYNSTALDVDADGERTVAEMEGWQRVVLYRRSASYSIAQQWAAYIQDTIVKGNFTLSLGLRFDKQWPGGGAYFRDAVLPGTSAWDAVFSGTVSGLLDPLLPDISVDAVKGIPLIVEGEDRAYQWNTFSPRIGLTWDISGDGKTVAKLALSQYGDIMGVGWRQATPYGTGGGIRLWWKDDVTPNNLVDWNEVYWAYSSAMPVGTRYVPYRLWEDANGTLTAEAQAALAGGTVSDAYRYGNYYSYDFTDPGAPPDYTNITTYFLNRGAQTSSRTREILLTLEREILPDLSASISFSYRKFDKDQIGMTYYPAEHANEYIDPDTGENLVWGDQTPYDIIIDPRNPPEGCEYVQAGTIPDTYYIGGTFTGNSTDGYTWSENLAYEVGDPRRGTMYNSGEAGGKPFYLPGPDWPTVTTRYSVIRNSDNYFTYTGVDLVLNKRLSNKWFANASFTWQAQRAYWGTDYFNDTMKWAFDGKPYGDWGGSASGKQAALMYTRWMVKFQGLYQLPWGFDISGTFNAREGWSVPAYFTLDYVDAPNYSAGHSQTIYHYEQTRDKLPTFYNITARIQKRINIGQSGRLYLMADVMNLLNSNMAIRSYSNNYGTIRLRNIGGDPTDQQQYYSSYYNYTGLLNEILNPRIWRFGVRFEF